jgi:hypothetical protein
MAIEAAFGSRPDFAVETPPADSQFAAPKTFFRWMQLGESA